MSNKDNLNKLFRLTEENPELPVIPMVNSDVTYSEYCLDYHKAKIGNVYIGDYIISEWSGILWQKTDYDYCENLKRLDELLEDFLSEEKFIEYSNNYDLLQTEKQKAELTMRIVENLPWKKAIIVNIEPPEDEL